MDPSTYHSSTTTTTTESIPVHHQPTFDSSLQAPTPPLTDVHARQDHVNNSYAPPLDRALDPMSGTGTTGDSALVSSHGHASHATEIGQTGIESTNHSNHHITTATTTHPSSHQPMLDDPMDGSTPGSSAVVTPALVENASTPTATMPTIVIGATTPLANTATSNSPSVILRIPAMAPSSREREREVVHADSPASSAGKRKRKSE